MERALPSATISATPRDRQKSASRQDRGRRQLRQEHKDLRYVFRQRRALGPRFAGDFELENDEFALAARVEGVGFFGELEVVDMHRRFFLMQHLPFGNRQELD